MPFKKLKESFKNSGVHQRYLNHRFIRQQNIQRANQAIVDGIKSDPKSKKYKSAQRALKWRGFGLNLHSFGKWLFTGLIWLVIPYIPYSYFQSLMHVTLINPRMTPHLLWGVQETLLMYIGITTALTCAVAIHLIHRGWWKRPGKRQAFLDAKRQLNSTKTKKVKK